MNFSASPSLSHPSQSPTADNNNGYRRPSQSNDPISSLQNSLADLSVGNAYSATGSSPQQQHYDYMTAHGNQGMNGISAPGAISSEQVDLSMIGRGGGEGFRWGSSHNVDSGLNRHQSAGSSISTHQNYSGTLHVTADTNEQINQTQRKRGESIDIFLSRSPSQSLGSEFLKLRSDDNLQSIPPFSLDLSNQRSQSMSFVGQQQQQQSLGSSVHDTKVKRHMSSDAAVSGNAKHGRDMSPSCSVTGTSASSRSVSPPLHAALHDVTRRSSMPGIGNTISQYHPNDRSATMSNNNNIRTQVRHRDDLNASYESTFSSSGHPVYTNTSHDVSYSQMSGNFNSTTSMESSREYQGFNNSNHDLGSSGRDSHLFSRQQQGSQTFGGGGMIDNSGMQQPNQQHNVSKDAKPQPQMFYVAVPTEDGHGQVLQPIQMQMVQIPGQPNAFVLPAPTNHGSNIVGANTMQQGAAITMPMGGVGSLHNAQNHHDRNKGYGAGHLPTHSNHQYNIDDNFPAAGYHDDMVSHGYADNRLRATRPQVNREPVANPTSDIVASLYASPQRPPLRELLGHVRRLSRDQVGCRLLQQALDEEGVTAASMILNEGLSFWGEAMVDPFGNYLFQKILEKITAEERIILVQNVSPRLVNASLNLHGTRSVQKVVELCAIDEKESAANAKPDDRPKETASEILTRSLAPAAARLCIDSHGNHVIQRILLKLPYQYSHFVFDAVANSVGDVARHRHGCCVIQRCLDSPPSAARSNLVHRIVEKSLELMQDAYGNYVVQYVLDVCSDDDVHAVCESVVGKVTLLAIQKFSSNVMEKCLERCTDKVREMYLSELSDSERIRELMMDPFGNYVIQRALAVSTHAQAVQLVEAMKPHLFSASGGGIKNTAGGRRIIAKISKRFPNFNVGDETGEALVPKNGNHKKSGNGNSSNNSRHDNGMLGEQSQGRYNHRRGQGKFVEEFSDQQKRHTQPRFDAFAKDVKSDNYIG